MSMHCALLTLSMLVLATPVVAKDSLGGYWSTPMGLVKLRQKGEDIRATLVKPVPGCGLKKNAVVLDASRLEDNVAGQITVCQNGPGCPASTSAFVILLLAPDAKSLNGALHLGKGCALPNSKDGRGLRLLRSSAVKPKKDNKNAVLKQTAKNVTAAGTSQELLEQGFSLLMNGKATEARKLFTDISVKDPSRVEAYIGVGVSYYLQHDYTKALLWYKKALEINPDFGDSYYNMACIYALENKKELSLRYLRIALLNGYINNNDAAQIAADDDFASLRDDADFKSLLQSVAPVSAPSPESAASATPSHSSN